MNNAENLYNIFLENYDEFFLAISNSGLAFELNHNVASICMTNRLEILGKNFFDICRINEIYLSFGLEDIKKNKYIDGFIKTKNSTNFLRFKVIKMLSDNEIYYIVIGKDITELLSYKKSFISSQMYLQKIIENLPQYVYWKDVNFVYQGCNKLVSEYLNLQSPKDIIGKTDNDFGWSSERVSFLRAIDESIILSGEKNSAEDIIPLNNVPRVMLSTKAPLYDDLGKIIGIIGVSVDITELKETQAKLATAELIAEKEQEMRKTVMMLVGDIVHDLRTPIATINTDAHILEAVVPDLRKLIKDACELKSDNLQLV